MTPATTGFTTGAQVQIHLRLSGGTAAAVAWLIAGCDPNRWVEELCTWGVPLHTIQLLLIPTSSTDRAPVGVLAFCAGAVPPPARALPYACRAGRLYLPVEATLHPPMSDDEVRAACPWPVACFHPSIGLIAGSDSDLLRACDLLVTSQPTASTWDFALPGIMAEPRIRSVHPAEPPTTDDVFALSRDDIGRLPADDLPPTEDESVARQIARRTQLGWAKAIRSVIPKGKADSTPGFLGKLRSWADQRTQELQQQLNSARQRELSRLMKLLEKDPDQGLRFALPLHSPPSARGNVQGGSILPPRSTNFSLGNLFGSRPIASWETPYDAQEKLRTRYRELATRELALGRFRRAAYIFGELLGDFSNAANALEQGRFFHEAAVLYRDKLSTPALAAACLERGGLLTEASALYVQLQQFEKAGDLHRTMGDEDEAVRLFRLAAEQFRTKGDFLAVARVHETKLNEPDEALRCLTAAWPNTNQAAECLRESFHLLARLNRFDEMQRRIQSFRDSARYSPKPLFLATVLVEVAQAVQNKQVREVAEDTARVIAGYELGQNPSGFDGRDFLNVVSRSCAEDRLLYRDTVRFRDAGKKATVAPTRPSTPPALPTTRAKGLQVTRIRTIKLDESVRWKSAATITGGFIAVGTNDQHEVVVTRSTWAGQVQTVRLRLSNADLHEQLRLAVTDTDLVIAPLGTHARVSSAELPAASGFPKMRVAPERLLPAGNIFGVAVGDEGDLHLLYTVPDDLHDRPIVYERRRMDGVSVSTHTLPLQEPQDGELASLWMYAHADAIAFTHLDQLHWHARGVMQDPVTLPRVATGLAGPARLTAFRFAIALEDGGAAIVWPRQANLTPFASAAIDAKTLITREGFVIAMGDCHGFVYEVKGTVATQLGSFKEDAATPVQLLLAEERQQFAALHSTGKVDLFEVR